MRHLRKICLQMAAWSWPFLGCSLASQADALPDAQGWSGSGWYITGAAPLIAKPATTPAYILFNGPHDSRSGCALAYDRFYSPIGICRLLDKKPGT